MCKGGGKGLAGEMYKLKDFEPAVQAKVWAVMGTNSEGKGDQLAALLRACEVLGGEPLQKVDYQIALAEWLFCNDFPLRDAEDQLAAAVRNPASDQTDDPTSDPCTTTPFRAVSPHTAPPQPALTHPTSARPRPTRRVPPQSRIHRG